MSPATARDAQDAAAADATDDAFAPSCARVVAIVPVHDGEHVLAECLDALLASQASLRIVVVDDASRDRSLAVARRHAAGSNGRIRVIALDRNRGFAGAVNRAVAVLMNGQEPPDLVALVNQDCFVEAGWLAPLIGALADPQVAVAGARLLDADGVTLQHAGARVEPNGLTSHFGRGSTDPASWRTPRDVDYVCGALVALRTETWRRLGPFDEGYRPAYFEEVDWCRRARRAGLRVVYVPGCEARHVEASVSGAGSRVYLRRYHRNRLRFVVRHLLGENGVAAWLRAEGAWLLRLRRWAEIAPVLSAYLRVPWFAIERLVGRSGASHEAASGGRSIDVAALVAAGREGTR